MVNAEGNVNSLGTGPSLWDERGENVSFSLHILPLSPTSEGTSQHREGGPCQRRWVPPWRTDSQSPTNIKHNETMSVD